MRGKKYAFECFDYPPHVLVVLENTNDCDWLVLVAKDNN